MPTRAKPNHLRRLHVKPDLGFLPSDAQGFLRGDARTRILARTLDAACSDLFLAFRAHAENTLRRARQPIGETGIREINLRLSAAPTETPEPEPVRQGWISLDIACDPLALLTLPNDRTKLGEWVIARAQQGLERLEALYAGFPPAPIREAIHNFRVCDHAFAFRAGERMIPGTRVKGRIDVEVTCRDTRRYFSALYRGKPLLRVEIPAIERPDIQVSNHFSGFEFAHGVVTIPAHQFWPLDEERRPDYMKSVEIDLRDHPEAHAFMRAKGWIGAPADE